MNLVWPIVLTIAVFALGWISNSVHREWKANREYDERHPK